MRYRRQRIRARIWRHSTWRHSTWRQLAWRPLAFAISLLRIAAELLSLSRREVNSLVGIPMRDRAATRGRILDAAYALFYRHGYARIGVDAIAAKANVTKRTLDDHFRSKDALLAAVFELHHGL